MNGFCALTGDAWRWPDVLDRWKHWEHTYSTLWAYVGVHHWDLCQLIANVLDGVDIDERTPEEDWTIANVIDAAVAEQARRRGILDARYFERTAPRSTACRTSSTQHHTRHRSALDDRFSAIGARLAWHGVMKRNVV